ncbi:glycosyltransferase [Jinshanibacter sp. LJY008]|uniref:Glycosyltransferase n=1 Tax=Limnobaculum eriocheiris TaxID=2897391 RepID=A0A9X1MY88_9GAMM|nr:glycosyltransferase [Limnobaculum eriocheiris]MCD1126405.1 glycosyltransferase [Limnobaculum eriocheiris]
MKKNNFILSVIIPCYNSEEFIAQCLLSITEQVPANKVQIIIINDGSSDQSDRAINDFLASYSNQNILYQYRNNAGVSAARNAGLDLAEGNYITFIDSDDLLRNNYWSVIEPLILSEQYDLIDFKYDRFYQNNNEIKILSHPNSYQSTSEYNLAQTFKTSAWHVWTRVIKRELATSEYFEVGKRYEDMLYTPYLYLKAKKILHLDHSLYLYRDNPNSITRNIRAGDIQDISLSVKKMIRYIKDNHQENDEQLKELTTYMIVNFVQEVRKMYKKIYGYYNYNDTTIEEIKEFLSYCDRRHISLRTYLRMRFLHVDKLLSRLRYKQYKSKK